MGLDHGTAVVAEQLGERLRCFELMFRAGNVPELVEEFYTDNVVAEGTGVPKQVGKPAISALFCEILKDYAGIEIAMDDISRPSEDLAYCFITNRNLRRDGSIDIHRATLVWRLVDGKWLCEADFFYIP
ncbi:MAG: hypothetical protein JWR80_6649 [Bradyrhizobium sp.]|nr:hypothetical protein [Bradyrhizobium sp.]